MNEAHGLTGYSYKFKDRAAFSATYKCLVGGVTVAGLHYVSG